MAWIKDGKIQIYKISTDTMEDITLDDVNLLEDAAQAVGRLVNGMRELIAHEGAVFGWPDRLEGRKKRKETPDEGSAPR